MRYPQPTMLVGAAILIVIASVLTVPATQAQRPAGTADPFLVDRGYCAKALAKVDSLVRLNFFDAKIAQERWPESVAKHRQKILGSRNLAELSDNMNLPIKELGASHCQFVTRNDETYYFLYSLFSSFSGKPAPKTEFIGAITGGVNCLPRQVRYVLDGSEASRAGIKDGDMILKVGGAPYKGMSSFWGRHGRPTAVELKRGEHVLSVSLTPRRLDVYPCYVAALEKSVKVSRLPEGSVGYVHLWCGGTRAHEAFEAALSEKLDGTDGLILDLRDGYGANYFDDLDYFYRPPAGYPVMRTRFRSGKSDDSRIFYDKPVVAIINGGARSGRELVAYSLKKTGRARLVGEKTAGAVLAGKLFDIDGRSALYLAVASGTVDGVNLEGNGVEPDITVAADCSQAARDHQVGEARRLLLEELAAGRAASATVRPAATADGVR